MNGKKIVYGILFLLLLAILVLLFVTNKNQTKYERIDETTDNESENVSICVGIERDYVEKRFYELICESIVDENESKCNQIDHPDQKHKCQRFFNMALYLKKGICIYPPCPDGPFEMSDCLKLIDEKSCREVILYKNAIINGKEECEKTDSEAKKNLCKAITENNKTMCNVQCWF